MGRCRVRDRDVVLNHDKAASHRRQRDGAGRRVIEGARRPRPGYSPRAMDNVEIARALGEVADVLEIQGANSFRIRAYRNAVRTIEVQTESLESWLAAGRPLTELAGIGKEMAAHVRELLETGTFAYRDQLLAEIPRSVLELLQLPGIGPGKVRRLWEELKIAEIDQLEAAAKEGRVAQMRGFGPTTEERILGAIRSYRERSNRLLWSEAERHLEPLLDYLRADPQLVRLEAAGSFRRRCETIGDLDLLALAHDTTSIVERFVGYPQVAKVLMSGTTRATVVLGSGLQVDLRVVEPVAYGAALVYFTGSKEHNVKLRRRALGHGLRLSEYGLEKVSPTASEVGANRVSTPEEADVYRAVGLEWIPPELREDRGEIEAAASGGLPRLVTEEDLRGDLHMHTTWSDGRASLAEMVVACRDRGYSYLAISDHSKALAMTNGLDAARLAAQWEELAAVQTQFPDLRLLRSLEIDILADGTLDLEEEMLAGLDLVMVSVHSRFDLGPEEQTARILRAIEHPRVQILAHPTGRLINRRRPLGADVPVILKRAAELGVALEINSQPDRLDLPEPHLRLARELGCKLVISSDSHRMSELAAVRFGVAQARRGGLEADQILNTLPLEQFLARIARP
jgi:DNA polymerase (family X)